VYLTLPGRKSLSSVANREESSMLIRSFSVWSLALSIFGGSLVARAATPPVQYHWDVGHTVLPTMMNNANGYCWLSGIEASNGGLTSNSDYVYLTFDSKWNWTFSGSVTGTHRITAFALCQPWSSLRSSGSGSAYYAMSSGFGGIYHIPDPTDSYCSLAGLQGNLIEQDNSAACGLIGGTTPAVWGHGVNVFGQCAVLGSSSQRPPATVAVEQGPSQMVYLGNSNNVMCTIYDFDPFSDPTEPYVAYLWLDTGNNYYLYTGGGIGGKVGVTCIAIPAL
jgi:hypothetical protein